MRIPSTCCSVDEFISTQKNRLEALQRSDTLESTNQQTLLQTLGSSLRKKGNQSSQAPYLSSVSCSLLREGKKPPKMMIQTRMYKSERQELPSAPNTFSHAWYVKAEGLNFSIFRSQKHTLIRTHSEFHVFLSDPVKKLNIPKNTGYKTDKCQKNIKTTCFQSTS